MGPITAFTDTSCFMKYFCFWQNNFGGDSRSPNGGQPEALRAMLSQHMVI